MCNSLSKWEIEKEGKWVGEHAGYPLSTAQCHLMACKPLCWRKNRQLAYWVDYKIALTPGLMCALNLLFAKRFLDIQLFKGNEFTHLPKYMKRNFFHDDIKIVIVQLLNALLDWTDQDFFLSIYVTSDGNQSGPSAPLGYVLIKCSLFESKCHYQCQVSPMCQFQVGHLDWHKDLSQHHKISFL